MGRIIVVSVGLVSLLLLGGCTDAGETTQVSAATGGAIGAGLGAIIGHQTGETGGGLVIGGLAGAATGAAIGNAIQAQEEAIQTQDEALERQQQLIRAQAAELSELRRLSQDSVTYRESDLPVSGSIGGPVKEKRVPVRYLKPPSGLNSVPLSTGRTATPSADFSAPSHPAQQAVRQHQPQPVMSAGEQVIARVPQLPGVNQEPQADNIQYGGAPRAALRFDDRLAAAAAGATAGEGFVQQEKESLHAEPLKVEQAARLSAGATSTAECQQADQEMHKADIAQESADKLFHIRRALRLCPDNAGYHGSLGDVYLKLGRREDARFEFEQALKLDPALHSVRASLASLTEENIY